MEPPPPSPSSTGDSTPNVTSTPSGTVKSKEEKLKELYQELEKLQTSFPTQAEGEPVGRYPQGWDENDWEKDFETHPIFMTKSPENPQELPPMVEAIRQLKYDPQFNSKEELAEKYKKEGNENFRLMKYRWAIESFTTGIKQSCDDNELNSQLFGNRAACHFRLGNHRSCIRDCQASIKLNPGNKKVVIRAAESIFILKDFRECVDFCKQHVARHVELEDFMVKSLKEIAKLEEEVEQQEKNKESEANHRKNLLDMVRSRGICLKGNLFESMHPAASGYHVKHTFEGDLLWPVIFVYPEYSQTDFIQDFHENDSFTKQFKQLFGDPLNRPAWDSANKYIPDKLKIFYMDSSNPDRMIPFDPKKTLKEIMTCPDYKLVGANPVFSIVA